MSIREWVLSALFVGFFALKVAEGALALESWPLSHVPMFSQRQPPESLPLRLYIYALRRGTWFEMQPFQFGLNRAELNARLLHDAEPGPACAELVRSFNARRPVERRVEAAYASRVTLARPGTGKNDEEQRSDCPLPTEDR